MTNSSSSIVRIGTRGSPLALAQARELRDRLIAAHPGLAAPDAVEIVVITTTGDRVTDRNLAAIGGKGLFTKEIEEALAGGGIDLAVHSMKDVPTVLPNGLVIDCYLPREDPRDALFIAGGGAGLAALEPRAVVGTSSLRRQALLLYARPDLQIVPFRGNVETRLAKLAAGTVDATLLAVAGLKRLGKTDAMVILSPEEMMPAAAQGAIGIERRQDDDQIAALLAPLNDAATFSQVTAERALLAALDGSCRTPIGALARLDGERLHLSALVIEPDGSGRHAVEMTGTVKDAERIGRTAGAELKALQRGQK